MSIENEKTLEIYNKKAKTYLKTSIEHDNLNPEKAKQKREQLEKFIKTNIGTLPKGAKIFEIGSADFRFCFGSLYAQYSLCSHFLIVRYISNATAYWNSVNCFYILILQGVTVRGCLKSQKKL